MLHMSFLTLSSFLIFQPCRCRCSAYIFWCLVIAVVEDEYDDSIYIEDDSGWFLDEGDESDEKQFQVLEKTSLDDMLLKVFLAAAYF